MKYKIIINITITTPANDFEYSISDGKVTITKYMGSGGDVIVPRKIKHKPVTSIDNGAFHNCTKLTSVTIPASVTSIGGGAFSGCTGLANVIIPDSVTSIGNMAFYNCTKLTSITIPDSVTSIGIYAFYNCTELTSITIGDSVTSIGYYAFDNTGYYNNSSNWENGALYIGKYLIKVKDDITGSYAVKDGTRLIADYAFEDCTGLTSVIIPDSVTSIGFHAFYGCDWELEVTAPNKFFVYYNYYYYGYCY